MSALFSKLFQQLLYCRSYFIGTELGNSYLMFLMYISTYYLNTDTAVEFSNLNGR